MSDETLQVCGEEAPELDEASLVLKRLLAAHEGYFNVFGAHDYAGRHFDGYAEFHSTGQKYVLTKKAQLWQVDSYEYLFFNKEEHLTAETLADYVHFMTTDAIGKVNPDETHMSSFLSLVLIANSCDESVEKAVRKANFRKNFAWGFRGWADLRLCVIDLSTRTVMSNAAGKEMKPTLEANAGFAGSTKNRRR